MTLKFTLVLPISYFNAKWIKTITGLSLMLTYNILRFFFSMYKTVYQTRARNA